MAHCATLPAFGNTPARSGSSPSNSQVTCLARTHGDVGSSPYERQDDGNDLKVERIVCDFRPGCALILDLFPANSVFALLAVRSAPHLAEALFQSGLITNGGAAIDMALAIQESRRCPSFDCSCLGSHEPAKFD